MEEFFSSLEELESDRDKYKEQAECLENDVSRLSAENMELKLRAKIENRQARSGLRKHYGIYEESLKQFKRLCFDRSAVETIAKQFFDHQPLFSVLTQLDKVETVEFRRLSSVGKGWCEINKRIQTGQKGTGNLGRIYYHPLPDGRQFVVVHRKQDEKEQKIFMNKLPDMLSNFQQRSSRDLGGDESQ